MLNGGLANGHWEIYGDFERQSIYSQLEKNEMFSLINKYTNPTKFILKINCRNTKQIGEETALISGFEKPPFLLEHLEGIPVEYIFFSDEKDQKNLLEAQLKKFTASSLPLKELMILSNKKIEFTCANLLVSFPIKEIKKTSDLVKSQDFFGFATVQSYKGMESYYIVITDIDDLSSELAKSLLYVGMSRAKYGLILLIAESKRNNYREILKRKLT